MTYRRQLLAALTVDGWELVQTESQHCEWWFDECWVIRSVREAYGKELFIFFLVDPQWEGPRKPGQGVREVAATESTPRDRLEAGRSVATLQMWKGRWDLKLATFISALAAHRRETTNPKEPSDGEAMAPN